MKYFIEHPSPLGALRLVATASGLCGVYFEQHAHRKHDPEEKHDPQASLLQVAAQQVSAYLAGQRRQFDLDLDLRQGTPFQRQVWQALQNIAYAQTMTYAELAQAIDRPLAVRAVGAANGRNPLSLIIPCHRVIASTGALHGYAGGLERKRVLLEMERGNVGK